MTPEKVTELLPAVMQATMDAGSPLDALVRVMAALHTSVEEGAGQFPQSLSPWQAPAPFVPMLERWVGLQPGLAVDEARARNLLGRAAELWRLRGTVPGIVRLLELATGVQGFQVRSGAEPFTLVVHAPPEARPQEGRVLRIVHAMKPAAVRCTGITYPEVAP
jgi:phage tail-like protein